MEKVYDYVVDIGTVTEIDYAYINEKYAGGNDLAGGCSAIVKTTEDGKTLVGRNMDLYFSNNPAYIIRTAVEGCYKTVGVAYGSQNSWPTYEQVLAEGLPEDKYKELPFVTTDILNSQGLYVEINMRNAEFWPSGDSKFACTGTNPEGSERVFVQCLTRYIAEHCATVDEAVAYVNGFDIFTGSGKHSWNFCFLLADATGHYGLLEIASDRVIWHDSQTCQTNFYIDEALAKIEEYKCGLGRYEHLMSHIDTVQTAEELFTLMNQVSYFKMFVTDCPFELRSEYVGAYPWWTNTYMEANGAEIDATLAHDREVLSAADIAYLRDAGSSWLSVFTTVTDCSEKTMRVRFFEDDEKTVTLLMDETDEVM